MKIVTITLNPAFDVHCEAESFYSECENFANIISRDAGGKGVNISRALTANDIENTAFVLVGEENGESFLKSLKADNMSYKELFVSGRIRENITIHTKNRPETRISFSGFCANNCVLEQITSELLKESAEELIICLTGRIADGMDISDVKKFLLKLKSKGAKLVIDSRSFGKEDIKEVAPWLIKPNEEEIAMYSDICVTDEKTAAQAAVELKNDGIENVIISLGGKGAVLACDDGVYFARTPKIQVVSTIGAGDSLIAGFIGAVKCGKTCEEALKTAVSYGSSACMTKGTRPPQKHHIQRIFDEVEIIKF